MESYGENSEILKNSRSILRSPRRLDLKNPKFIKPLAINSVELSYIWHEAAASFNLRKFLENVMKTQAHWEFLKDHRDPRKILGNVIDSQKKSQKV